MYLPSPVAATANWGSNVISLGPQFNLEEHGMHGTKRVAVGLVVAILGACGPAEIRIDETKGVPPVKGSTELTLEAFTCGQPITAGAATVTTKVVTGGCELSIDKEAPVLAQADYAKIPDLQGASSLVQRVELTIKKLTFTDSATGTVLDLNTRITSATFAVNGQQIADKASLVNLPKTVSLQGDALSPIKTKVDGKQPFNVQVKVVVVVPDSPRPPTKMKVDFEAQPAIIVGPGTIKL